MTISKDKTLLDYFYYWEKTNAEKVYLKQPFGSNYFNYTWEETGLHIRKIANYLKSLQLPEKTNIGIVSKNCAEWVIADLAIMMAGHVSVPFYATLTHEQLNQVLVHSGCRVLFVGKLDDWQKMKAGIPAETLCISFPTYNPDKGHIQWDDIIEKNLPLTENPSPSLDELCSIVYTSGTTGNPKGVMLSYRAFATSLYNAAQVGKLYISNPVFFSYLPLSHIAERNVVESASLAIGGTIYFTESIDTFSANLKSASPTHFLAVPRIWTKFQQGILAKLSQSKLNILLKIPIVNTLIKKQIKSGLGLDKAVLMLTGAAPMPSTLIKWFRKLDINIQEAYGMTENMGAVSMMPLEKIKDGFVGKLYDEIEVKIDEHSGEILTRSAWNMLGYYKEPQMTADTIDDENWIHTGDVGEVDNERYLKITGRVKDMYKTSKGEYVAPAQLEMGFADNLLIDQICIVGQGIPQPIALVVLSETGKEFERHTIEHSLALNLKAVNQHAKSYEKIKKIVIIKDAWTVDNNKLTPTFKIKRNVVEKEFAKKIETWYEQADLVIWE